MTGEEGTGNERACVMGNGSEKWNIAANPSETWDNRTDYQRILWAFYEEEEY